MRLLAAVAALSLTWASLATAGPLGGPPNGSPTILVGADDFTYEVPAYWKVEEGQWVIGDVEQDFWSVQTSEYLILLSGGINPDPSTSYGLSVTDFGLPSSFALFVSNPIVPTAGPTLVTNSIVGGLTDATQDGISITPAFLPDLDGDTVLELQTAEAGVPLVSNGIDVGPAFAAGPGGIAYAYGPFGLGPVLGPTPGPYTVLDVAVGFTLSGGGDIAALTGFASIETVPEPSTVVLAGLGALALLVARRRGR